MVSSRADDPAGLGIGAGGTVGYPERAYALVARGDVKYGEHLAVATGLFVRTATEKQGS